MVLPSGVGKGAKGCQAADCPPSRLGTAESGKLLAGHAAGQAQAGQIFGALVEDESDSEDEGPPGVVDTDGEEDYEDFCPAAGRPSPLPHWHDVDDNETPDLVETDDEDDNETPGLIETDDEDDDACF